MNREYLLLFHLNLKLGCEKMDEFYSVEDFFSIAKIDAHLHYYSENNLFIELAKQHNIRLLSINVDFLEDEWMLLAKQRAIASKMMANYNANFAFIGAVPMVHPLHKSHITKAISHIDKAIEKGAIGVKIWKNVGMKITYEGEYVMINNPIFQPLLSHLSSHNTPLLGHFGEPRNCWLPLDEMTVSSDQKYYAGHPEFHMYLRPEMPSYHDQIDACDQMLSKNTDLKFIGAHLGSSEYSITEMARRLDQYPNLMFDMAERICHLQYQSISNHAGVYNFLVKYQDRLMYGSDMVFTDSKNEQEQIADVKSRWLNQWCFLTQNHTQTTWEVKGTFKGMALPKKVIDKIYYHNALRTYPKLSQYFTYK